MTTFSEYQYTRPNIEQIKISYLQEVERFKKASTAEVQDDAMKKINEIAKDFSTQANLAYIRASIDTNDTFYQAERDFIDEVEPSFQELETIYYEALMTTPFRSQLEMTWGSQLFTLAENAIKTFSSEILPLLQEENKLTSQYSKLIASAQIPFEGDVLTLAQLSPYAESTERLTRKKAMEASASFFVQHEKEFDKLYDDLVKLRHKIAIKLGFNNFVELGYLRMNRIGYNAQDVKVFRDQVRDYIVPLANELYAKQAERIEIEDLKYYDLPLNFLSGNATPKGSPDWIIEKGQAMYEELSPETAEFFSFMTAKELMDLEAKKGKESGGYCTFIDNYESPFIFSNFNGTSADIDVLTHEAGHAFQVYCSRHLGVPEYSFPTYEAAEIHSMSMEFFTWPWMKNFFKEDTEKYKFAHLNEALQFLPYGVAVDEFQHIIYENPTMSPTERKAKWRQLEETYLPHRDYDGHPYLEAGGFWQRQSHIYQAPFYYIDYTLAQICAFQFWVRMQKEDESAWDDYLHLCSLGGSKPFLELIKEANLLSPFKEGSIETVIGPIQHWLNGVKDAKL